MPRRSAILQPLPLVISGSVLIAWSGIFVRLADLPPTTSAFLRCAYALPVLAALAVWWGRTGRVAPLDRRARAWAIAAGLCFGVDLLLWHVAIGAVGAGLATVLGNSQVVFFPLAAWLVWREQPTRRQLAVLPILLIGVLLISGAIGARSYGDDPLLGAITGALTGVAYAGFLLCLRAGGQDGDGSPPVAALTIATGVAALVAACGGLVVGEFDVAPTWPAHGWMVLLALLCQVLAWLFIAGSLNRMRAARISILLLIQPVVALALGVIVLDESPSIAQWTGSTLVLGGVVLGTRGGARGGE